MEIKKDLHYTKEHEWISLENGIATVGISEFAQSELGDIVYIEVDQVDEVLNVGDSFGSIEAVKTVSDLFMPLSGKVLEFNPALENEPELVNADPYGKGWIIKIETKDSLEQLLSAAQYEALIK